jgi:hypothetical protein
MSAEAKKADQTNDQKSKIDVLIVIEYPWGQPLKTVIKTNTKKDAESVGGILEGWCEVETMDKIVTRQNIESKPLPDDSQKAYTITIGYGIHDDKFYHMADIECPNLIRGIMFWVCQNLPSLTIQKLDS